MVVFYRKIRRDNPPYNRLTEECTCTAQRILTTMVKVVVSAAMARAWSCSARGRESLTREGRSCYCVRQTQILILFAGSNIQTTVMIRLGKQDNVGYIAIYLFSFSHFGYITIFSSLIFLLFYFSRHRCDLSSTPFITPFLFCLTSEVEPRPRPPSTAPRNTGLVPPHMSECTGRPTVARGSPCSGV